MGGNCSPLIADLYLSWLEYKYVLDLMNNKNFTLAKRLSSNSRYIDDIITPNTTHFLDIAASIYPKELPLEMSTNNHFHDCFLDLDIMVLNDKFITKIYHKVDLFNFEVISFPLPDSNIPSNIGYSTFLSQLIRYSRVCSRVDDFAFRAKLIYDKLMHRGYESKMLKRYITRFCCMMSDRVCTYGYYNFSTFFEFCTNFTPELTQPISTTPDSNTDDTRDDTEPITSESEHIIIRIADAPAPLKNIGNTCYLNAVMQIIFMFNQVFNFGCWVSRNVDYSDVSNTDLQYYLIFQKFVYMSTLPNIRKEHLNDFVSFLSSIDGFFEIGSQKDAHEAFLKILDIFDVGISAVLPGHNTMTKTYFKGIFRYVETCTICSKDFFWFDYFSHISIQPLRNIKTAISNSFRDTSVERY